ncbi:hydro-lyases, Fe-S type, tartrate/fumarate subfamily, beta subunit [Thermosinus carboxydivorans Nor1]|uniref:Hydro-lyases, Fe-S type, tartrate/fumarate subfamily, beta subunit n=1 Tax=Thermosinus carboxydivorans Nor1 TaxID=401526 RepID=A1HQH4_9FIRM|nr:Fe-S-containing hydro-lyase [Thermosinus carboxydivorans]EAX47780.1 hydro-lyases, Fe-S type, tartrate/fumarate subfamily, beta subunit [Thermosinus carboxydivorans Nor1]
MPEPIRITTPLTVEKARSLKAGDSVLISGIIYTARDAAHKRMVEALDRGERLPVDLQDQIIYYVGPTPAKPGYPIGSAGPTTSGRMDAYTPRMLEQGLRGMIGKGYRQSEVVEAMKKYGAVYFAATGGAAALIAKTIKKYEVVAYEDLGTEAIARLTVEDFPAIVVIDSEGRNFYLEGQKQYRKYQE